MLIVLMITKFSECDKTHGLRENTNYNRKLSACLLSDLQNSFKEHSEKGLSNCIISQYLSRLYCVKVLVTSKFTERFNYVDLREEKYKSYSVKSTTDQGNLCFI
jgi:hypothetical protein